MRKTALLLALAVTLPTFAAASFAGRWALDPSRSQGNPPGLEQTVVIEQTGETLKVATNLVTDNVDRVVNDVYAIGAGEQDFAPQQPGVSLTSAKRTARRTGPRSFEATDRILGTSAGGPVDLQIERKWSLSDDGKTLTVDQAVTNSGFTTRSKRVLVSAPLASTSAPATARAFPVDLNVPVAPTAFSSAGKTNLVYELHLTSFRIGELEWKRLEVLGDDGQRLASYEGAELDGMLSRPGTTGAKDVRRIGPGLRAVAFLWVPVDGPAPRTVRHRAAFVIPASASGSERIVETAAVSVKPTALVIGPPVRGGSWVARWVSNSSFHRRALQPVDGKTVISQRFAIDWNRFNADGAEWTGDGTKNEQYSVYGQEVIAVADGTVAEVVSNIPENVPGSQNPAVPLTIETAGGNHVSLKLADGAFATYAHLQGASITVKEGQRVRRGDVLGRVGNSGNATGPHLHFQVATAPGLGGEGVPYQFDSFDVVALEEGPPNEGKMNGKTLTAEAHRGELPGEHMVVRFGDASAVAAAAPQPNQLSPEFQKAQQLFGAQKWSEAVAAYEAIIAKDKKDPRPRAGLAAALYALGQYDKALPIALEANRMLSDLKVQLQFPGLPVGMVMVRIARLYNRLGKTDEAFQWLEQAAKYPLPNFQSLESEADMAGLRTDKRWKQFTETVRSNADPCGTRAEFRQLDFWIGEWDVFGGNGQKVGTSRIAPVLNQCVILETYTAAPGTSLSANYIGQAFHFFDSNENRWVQHYLDTTGTPADWVGELVDGEMRYWREGPFGPSNVITKQRMSFTHLPDGKVRQIFEQSADGGLTWSTAFYGTYVKQTAGGSATGAAK